MSTRRSVSFFTLVDLLGSTGGDEDGEGAGGASVGTSGGSLVGLVAGVRGTGLSDLKCFVN